jgi:CRP/FNR family cyclic AMP-dependent transcriptional regulator
MSTTVAMIGEVPIFGLLDDEEREALAQMMNSRDFKKGETVFHYGDPGGEIFIIRTGHVELFVENTDGEKIVLSENEQGDVIGELSFLDGGPRTATAVASEDTQMLVLDRIRLLDFIDKHPHAAMDVLTVIGRRLRASDELLRTQVSRNPNVEEVRRFLDVHHYLRRNSGDLGHSEFDRAAFGSLRSVSVYSSEFVSVDDCLYPGAGHHDVAEPSVS